MPIRCVNLDWLEVFAFESRPCDANYFRSQGFWVEQREYGTRIYHEMFTVMLDGEPYIEVRRRPKNPLMADSACHLRLHNRTCYLPHAARLMQDFMTQHGFDFQRISRVDVCLDFVKFDDNTLPRIFMQRYMRGKFSKINQGHIHSHGTDSWTGRVWNSVSWGSPTSMVGTKFYNKTLELHDPKTDSYGKPYIRYAWLNAGLVDDMQRCTLNHVTQEIWRVEFSIRSSVKRWFVIELDGKAKKFYSMPNRLDCYDTPEKLLCIFASLSNHYFHFKRYEMGQRKDRCPDRILFRWKGMQNVVEIDKTVEATAKTPSPELLVLIKKLRYFLDLYTVGQIHDLIVSLLKLLEAMQQKQEITNGFDPVETLALQQFIARRTAGEKDVTVTAILDEIRETLKLNPQFFIF